MSRDTKRQFDLAFRWLNIYPPKSRKAHLNISTIEIKKNLDCLEKCLLVSLSFSLSLSGFKWVSLRPGKMGEAIVNQQYNLRQQSPMVPESVRQRRQNLMMLW